MDLLIATNTVPQEQADKAPASGTPGWATDGNPATGQMATDAPAWHYNMMMSELLAIIKAAGFTPSNSDWSQVLKAMQTIFSPAQYGVAPYSAQLAQLVGGYPTGAIVFDAAGNYWRSTKDSNLSVPGVDGATWESLFNGLATQAALTSETQQRSDADQALDKAITDEAAARIAAQYVQSVPGTGQTRITSLVENSDGRAVFGDGTNTPVLANLADLPLSSPSLQIQNFTVSGPNSGAVITTFPVAFKAGTIPLVWLRINNEPNSNACTRVAHLSIDSNYNEIISNTGFQWSATYLANTSNGNSLVPFSLSVLAIGERQ
ncbi:hypothetical protein [Acetobacter lovaniensis]|uniref:Tail fiber protein n=1 Tax=Acetobacter lovaniensis TaxID=104100 RepID=A0A841QEX2_9PROT|nr:hypothetical protein [Acetobacter lovaniensis]MBB6456996.1 hypothetical protein [Acetobacter lovaniensis]GBQ69551.1 hypothetical protein AA0474_1954 [Acetobacter lovaniensis NRIC 0474]